MNWRTGCTYTGWMPSYPPVEEIDYTVPSGGGSNLLMLGVG